MNEMEESGQEVCARRRKKADKGQTGIASKDQIQQSVVGDWFLVNGSE